MEDFAWAVLCIYVDACFSRFDEGALERAELEQLRQWNRGLARGMSLCGGLILLPLLVALTISLGRYAMGGGTLLGLEVEGCLFASSCLMLLAQLLLVVLLSLLCTLRLEWEPRGFVLALADLLHTTPRVLQNIWRFMVCLPLVSLLLVFL